MPDEEREAQISESTKKSTYQKFPTWLRNTGSIFNSCSIRKKLVWALDE